LISKTAILETFLLIGYCGGSLCPSEANSGGWEGLGEEGLDTPQIRFTRILFGTVLEMKEFRFLFLSI
jgi:hypothetical protein